ncbi:Transcription termination protein NusB [hydrothermal vent metagenome]|uniref:Transcription termination protein NusB n=1 Tax=hydrothermal vent metagenome TaxID=652676 RepID=A0A3B0TC79_9ZZZZ
MAKPKPAVSAAVRRRSMARLAVVQALYQMEIAQTDLNQVVAEFSAGNMGRIVGEDQGVDLVEPDADFFRNLIFGVVQNQKDIDPAINKALAKGWKLDRLDATLRAILRAGAYELKHRTDVPMKVAITEYLDIARAFFDGPEPKVVNGVLDALARKWGREETELHGQAK